MELHKQDEIIDNYHTVVPALRRKIRLDDDYKSVTDNLYFEDLVSEKEIYDWHEDLIIHELSGKNINLFYEIIEQRTLDEVWRMIALKRANEQ